MSKFEQKCSELESDILLTEGLEDEYEDYSNNDIYTDGGGQKYSYLSVDEARDLYGIYNKMISEPLLNIANSVGISTDDYVKTIKPSGEDINLNNIARKIIEIIKEQLPSYSDPSIIEEHDLNLFLYDIEFLNTVRRYVLRD